MSRLLPCLAVLLSATTPLAAPSATVATPAAPLLVDQVPDTAVAAVVVQRGALSLVRQYFDAHPEMRNDLSEFLLRTLKLDLTRIEGAVAWSSQLGGNQPTFGIFLRIPGAVTPRGQILGQHAGTQLVSLGNVVAAVTPGGVLLGNEAEVRAGVDAMRGKNAGQSPLGALIGADRHADLCLGILAAGVSDPSAAQIAQQFGIRAMTAALRNNGAAVVELSGDPSKLETARTLLVGGAQAFLQRLRDEKDRAAAGDDVSAGVAAIATYHSATAFWKEFQPRLAGDRLVSQYQFPELKGSNMVMTYAGVLSAVAIPAFMKYVRRSKTVEATINVRRLSDAAVAFRDGHRKTGKGFAFPASTQWTPAVVCCGQPGDKCPAASGEWKNGAWHDLDFSIANPHYYQYRFTSDGKGQRARFVVEARGDLDCDGIFSSYRRTGSLDAQGNVQISPLDSANEIE
jgi:type IV pilus assembly protein PilA